MEYLGHSVYITTQRWQKRKHRKKRINKKWAKRYGYHELEIMPHYQVIMTEDGTLWMTFKTWKDLQKGINEELIKNLCESDGVNANTRFNQTIRGHEIVIWR